MKELKKHINGKMKEVNEKTHFNYKTDDTNVLVSGSVFGHGDGELGPRRGGGCRPLARKEQGLVDGRHIRGRSLANSSDTTGKGRRHFALTETYIIMTMKMSKTRYSTVFTTSPVYKPGRVSSSTQINSEFKKSKFK